MIISYKHQITTLQQLITNSLLLNLQYMIPYYINSIIWGNVNVFGIVNICKKLVKK